MGVLEVFTGDWLKDTGECATDPDWGMYKAMMS